MLYKHSPVDPFSNQQLACGQFLVHRRYIDALARLERLLHADLVRALVQKVQLLVEALRPHLCARWKKKGEKRAVSEGRDIGWYVRLTSLSIMPEYVRILEKLSQSSLSMVSLVHAPAGAPGSRSSVP